MIYSNMTVEEYYKKQKSPQKEIALKLRDTVKSLYPKFKETMLWGVPVFENGLCYIVCLKDHVNLGFTVSNLTKEEEKLFEGGGKTTRKIEVRSLEDIDKGRIKKLVDFVSSNQ